MFGVAQMTDEQTLADRIHENIPKIGQNAVGLFHEKNIHSSAHDQYRSQLTAAIDTVVGAYAQLQQTHPGHPAVQLAKKELGRLCENFPQEDIKVGDAYRRNGLKSEAKAALERAAWKVDPAFWDDVADLEMELGNVGRAQEIWRKIIGAWDAKGEYRYAFKFALKLGDAALIEKYKGLAATQRA